MRDDVDENAMRRFLLGTATPEEQDQVEERLADRDFYHALAGLEEEMALQCVRGKLPVEWHEAFLSGPGRRRQVEEMRAFQRAIRTIRANRAAQRRQRVMFICAAAAAAVLLAAGATFIVRGRTAGPDAPAVTAVTSDVSPAGQVATLLLPSDLTRSGSAANTFRLPAGATQVRLRMTIQPTATESLQVTLTPVANPTRRFNGIPDVRRAGDELDLSWLVPVEQLRAGDYLLRVTAGGAPPGAEPVATRFFSIVE